MPDPIAAHHFISAIEPPARQTGPAWWFAFREGQLLVHDDESATVPHVRDLSELGLNPVRAHYLGTLDGAGSFAVELAAGAEPPEGMAFAPLRGLYGRLPDPLFSLAGRAIQVVEWDRTHRYCGRCGTATEGVPGERAKRCPNCGLLSYPRLSPAMIVLVARGDEVLLARSPHFPPGMYSVLAGFVEPGESLEEAAQREIAEETAIRIGNIRYFGSQPWPYPNSLMIGFTAEYAGGEIALDEREIADAGWYHVTALPDIPGRPSIARALLDGFVEDRIMKRRDQSGR